MPSHHRSILAGALAALLLAGLGLAQERPRDGASAPPRQTLAEEIEVREVELIVELPELSALRQAAFGPEDVLVIEDGLVRPVTRIGPIAEGRIRSALGRDEASELPDWTVVVYADEVLAKPDTAFYAALALAKRAARLTALGPVEIVAADPEPRVLLAPNREPRRVEQALVDLVARAGRKRDRPEPASEASSPRDAATLRRQLDRLVARAAAPRGGPRLLFLIADGFAVSPEELSALETGAAPASAPAGSPPERAAALLDAARLLAVYGWLVVPMPFREPEELGGKDRSPNDIDRFRANHTTGGGSVDNSVPPVLPPKQPRDSELRWEGVITTKIAPDLSPLRALVNATAGEMVAFDAQLDPTLDGLAGRWHLWFQAPDPHDGRLHAVQVQLRNGKALRTRRWLRSSTPAEIAEARLRRLLDGARLEPTLSLDAAPGADGGLRLRLAPFLFRDPAPAAPVRVSLAFARPDGTVEVRHQEAPALADPARGWSITLPLQIPPDVREVAVLAEDLARERWGAAWVLLDNEGGGPSPPAPLPSPPLPPGEGRKADQHPIPLRFCLVSPLSRSGGGRWERGAGGRGSWA